MLTKQSCNDFDGLNTTKQIDNVYKGISTAEDDPFHTSYTGAPAAEYCLAYSKGNRGTNTWWLPTTAELYIIAKNFNPIEECIKKMGGISLLYTSESTSDYLHACTVSRNKEFAMSHYYACLAPLTLDNEPEIYGSLSSNRCCQVRPVTSF